MEQVSGGVIERNVLAALLVDFGGHRIAGAQLAAFQDANMGKRGPDFLRIAHRKARILGDQDTRVADLTAAFRIEWRVVENNLALLSRSQHIDHGAIEYERRDPRVVRKTVITGKIRLAGKPDRITHIGAKLARRLR